MIERALTPDDYEARRLLLGYEGYDAYMNSFYSVVITNTVGASHIQKIIEVDADTLKELSNEEKRERIKKFMENIDLYREENKKEQKIKKR